MPEEEVTFSTDYVCVVCGRPWPDNQNLCACGGWCTWGPGVATDPSSWLRGVGAWLPRPGPPQDTS